MTGATKPYTVETTFVQVGQSTRKPWNFYYWPTKADAIHEPWAGGNGRVDTMQPAATTAGRHPGRLHRARPGHRPRRPQRPARNPAAAGDDITWFPNLYDDLTFRGRQGRHSSTRPPPRC